MSKNQQKQASNAANTTLSDIRNQGSANNQQLQGVASGYQNNAKDLYPGVAGGYSDIAKTGGYDPDTLATLKSGYSNMINTGGISADDETALRGRANATATSTYKTGEDQLKRNIAATGGFGFGDAAISSLARQGSEAATGASNDINARIVGMRNQNQFAGLEGLNSTQKDVTGGRLAGLSGSAGLYGTNVAATQDTLNQIIKNFQTTGSLSVEDLKVLTDIANKEPNWWNNVSNAIGTLGSNVAGIASGVGGL